MKQKLRSGRKGAGLELAMLAMVAVFLLCSGAVTASVLHSKQANLLAQTVSDRIVLDAMGDAYCSAVAMGISWTPEDDSYRAETVNNENIKTLRLYRSEDNTLLLTIVLEKTEYNYQVIQWTYE